jgi:Holliday junction DNA helicase RuvA
MFSHIQGEVIRFSDQSVLLMVNGLGYEIILAPCILEPLRRQIPRTLALEIYTHLVIDGNSGRFSYFGFNNTIEREFFEALISVASIGPRTAARAFTKPMAQIARAIDSGDEKTLTTLQGIGRQKAREIIAKLQGKVARFLLIPTQDGTPLHVSNEPEFVNEALEILLQLGYKDTEAATLIQNTIKSDPLIADVETLLARIYRQGNEIEV